MVKLVCFDVFFLCLCLFSWGVFLGLVLLTLSIWLVCSVLGCVCVSFMYNNPILQDLLLVVYADDLIKKHDNFVYTIAFVVF